MTDHDPSHDPDFDPSQSGSSERFWVLLLDGEPFGMIQGGPTRSGRAAYAATAGMAGVGWRASGPSPEASVDALHQILIERDQQHRTGAGPDRSRFQVGQAIWDAPAERALPSVRIKHARSVLGMTQARFADELGVTRETVARWETDARKPDAPVWLALRELARRHNLWPTKVVTVTYRGEIEEIT